ncbi:hypothetical protein FPV67DRAFT_1664201 [Lyophyllum atratum]|nr:hypothetical protein FPV67DRAFT_1664201 [Lyophyllum atratum]
MDHDVDDPEKGLDLQQVKQNGMTPFNRHKPHILSRIRNFNHLAISTIGSAFSGPLSAMSSYVLQDGAETPTAMDYDYETWDFAYDLEAGQPEPRSRVQNKEDSAYDASHAVGTSTPTQARSNSPLQSSRLSDMKRIFNNFARSRHADPHVQMHATIPSSSEGAQKSAQPPHQYQDTSSLYLSSTPSWDEPSGTPPLTPDSFDDLALPSPTVPSDYDSDYDDEYDVMEYNRSHSHSLEIKEGKKPERSENYDTLINDTISNTSNDVIGPDLNVAQNHQLVAVRDERDEWYGLEYTLELSCRERLPSDTKSAGEHSRSRESWAAIHRGRIHPFFEDEDYHQWKNWHRYLDRQDERRKHKRGWEFKARSKDLAWFYVDEMKTRDVMYWQQEVYGGVGRDVQDRLDSLAQHRPDPFFPPKKHGLGWYLKRSCSIACIRELRPLPALKHKPRTYGYNDALLDEFSIVDYPMFLDE